MSILARISYFIEFKGVSFRQFELSIGASNGLISGSLKKSTDIGSKWLSKIIEAYPDINPAWLLTGEGNMLRTDEPTTLVIEPPKHPNLTDALALLKAKDEQIDRLLGLLDKALSK